MTDIEAIVARHVTFGHLRYFGNADKWTCWADGQKWPCEVEQMNRALKAAEADADALRQRIEAVEQLMACLRIEKRPPEALWRLLDNTAGAAAAHDARRQPGSTALPQPIPKAP